MFVTRTMKTYKSSLNKFSQSKPTQHLASKKMEDHTCDQEVSTNKSRLSSELPVPDIIDYNLNGKQQTNIYIYSLRNQKKN